jgi:hypothetical protein
LLLNIVDINEKLKIWYQNGAVIAINSKHSFALPEYNDKLFVIM